MICQIKVVLAQSWAPPAFIPLGDLTLGRIQPRVVQIDESAVDAAAAASGFTGVVAIDAERVFERCYGFAHRALGGAQHSRHQVRSGGQAAANLRPGGATPSRAGTVTADRSGAPDTW